LPSCTAFGRIGLKKCRTNIVGQHHNEEATNVNATLAIQGGQPVIPAGTIQPWPPIDEVDRKMVLASLEGHKYTFGPNCTAFQEEFASWNGNRYATTTNSGTAALHMCIGDVTADHREHSVQFHVTAYRGL
jgi:hypothetical protein